jgi:hypothetical protein
LRRSGSRVGATAAACARRARGPLRPHRCHTARQRSSAFARRTPERHHALLVALARHAQDAAAQIEVRPVERDQLAHAQAGRVEQLEDDAIAIDQRAVAARRVEQQLDLGRPQVRASVRSALRRLEVERGLASPGLRAPPSGRRCAAPRAPAPASGATRRD